MKKQIIALRGKSNVGKSTALHLLYKCILSNPCVKPLYFETIGRKLDFLAILSVEGFIIGIFNRGDVAVIVQEFLDRLIDKKCQVIVCATRTKGDIDGVLASYEKKYKVTAIPKLTQAGGSESISNLATAHGLASMVYAAIDS